MAQSSIAVVILNWNGKHHMERFLPFLIERTPDHASLIVADGGSTDGSLAFLAEVFPSIRIIELGVNLGFAGGYNAALKNVFHDILILLNSDVEVLEGWLQPLVDHLLIADAHAACQPKVLSFKDPKRFEHAGASGGFMDRNAYPFCRGRIFHTFEEDKGQYNETIPVVWATGTCLAIKKKYFDQAGGFDADLFAHMEEIDLCWRLHAVGLQVHCVPASVIHHIGGGTLPYLHPRKTFLNFRNSLIVLTKNAPGPILLHLFRRLLLDGAAGLKFILDGNPQHTWQVFLAHWAFFFSFGKTWKKRRALKAQRPNSWPFGIYHRSIVVQYFFRGIERYSDLPQDQAHDPSK